MRGLVAPALDRLGWEARDGDADLERALRGALLQGLGVLGADPNAEAASRELEGESSAGVAVDPALAAAAVNVVAATGGEADYERFRQRSADAPTPQEQLRYLFALPLFRDPGLLDRTLQACLSGRSARRTPRSCSPTARSIATWARGAGRSSRITGIGWRGAFPSSLTIRMADGVRFLTKPEEVEGALVVLRGPSHPAVGQEPRADAGTPARGRCSARARDPGSRRVLRGVRPTRRLRIAAAHAISIAPRMP